MIAREWKTAERILVLKALCASVWLCLVCAATTFALDPRKTISQYVHDSWSTKDGLPSNTINAILQTRDGYLWLGTPAGLVRSSLAEARRSIHNLRSQNLEANDLPTAFSAIVKGLTSGTSTKIEMQVQGAARPLLEMIENNLFRIGQEALTNAVKHAGAQRIRLTLNYDEKNVQLLVQDDGHGFDPQAVTETNGDRFGLKGMRERAQQLGGHFALHTRSGEGTEIEVIVPTD